MLCTHCEIHFSGSSPGVTPDQCPYCGRSVQTLDSEPGAEISPDSAKSAPDQGLEISPQNEWRGADPRPGEQISGKRSSAREAPDRPANDTTKTEIADEWSVGSTVAGKYQVVSRLGAGGFGTVYKVRHVFRKKYYALKTPHIEFARDETFQLRFEREIEAMERFVHADAVMIRDSGITESGAPYYTMDFIEGESLKVVMQREKRLPVERALMIVRRVLRVLDVAHAHQIIHRDIKPDNILVTTVAGRETVKVLDFGVAKLLDLVGETGSVTKGMRVGTPKYMSPEQITGEGINPSCDLFSLGIVFYEMITGEHPFALVNDPIRVTAAILNREARPPRDIVPDLPKAISDHVLWMLEKKSKRRPESAAYLIKNLGAVEESVSRVTPPVVEAMEVCACVPRAAARPLLFRQETSVGERRAFLLFSEKVTFGRANDKGKGSVNDLILRCLPCRSRTKDPESWQRNLTISQHAGALYSDGADTVIEPSPQAKYGIGIGGFPHSRPARFQNDRFHFSLGDKALELDAHRRVRNRSHPVLDLSFLAHSRAPDVVPPEHIGYSNESCQIDFIHLRRASNWPLHEYFLVSRQLDIGSSANCGLLLRGPGIEAVHAIVLFEGGEAFLLPWGGKVQVGGAFDPEFVDPENFSASAEHFDLLPNQLLPLAPGLQLGFGGTWLHVESIVDVHFKTV